MLTDEGSIQEGITYDYTILTCASTKNPVKLQRSKVVLRKLRHKFIFTSRVPSFIWHVCSAIISEEEVMRTMIQIKHRECRLKAVILTKYCVYFLILSGSCYILIWNLQSVFTLPLCGHMFWREGGGGGGVGLEWNAAQKSVSDFASTFSYCEQFFAKSREAMRKEISK